MHDLSCILFHIFHARTAPRLSLELQISPSCGPTAHHTGRPCCAVQRVQQSMSKGITKCLWAHGMAERSHNARTRESRVRWRSRTRREAVQGEKREKTFGHLRVQGRECRPNTSPPPSSSSAHVASHRGDDRDNACCHRRSGESSMMMMHVWYWTRERFLSITCSASIT
jgi:hypothetical protein